LERLRGGATVALVSDAGTPLVSDPGARLVKAAIENGFEVEAVPGPSALLAALVVSGLATERWCFEGFLPAKGRVRAVRLAAIGAEADRAVVVFEAPQRVARLLDDLAAACGPGRPVAICRELTKLHEEVWRGPVGQAAERAHQRLPRGEHVIVVGPGAGAGAGRPKAPGSLGRWPPSM
jgi:16S rRNA (cytidine1402-2'-O)-methyltransferase